MLWTAGTNQGGTIDIYVLDGDDGATKEMISVPTKNPSESTAGYVWAVAFGNNATKLDPETGQTWTYGGLVGAYTYSDMTGYALTNVGTPSG